MRLEVGKTDMGKLMPSFPKMTSQEKKEFLQQYRTAEAEERRLELEIERWRARAAKMTAGYGSTPAGSGDGRSLERTVAHIDALIRQLTGQRDKLARLRREIGTAIDSVPDPKLQELLRLRYIENLSFERIAVKMNYSYVHVCRMHGQALTLIML